MREIKFRVWDTKERKYLYCEKQKFICTTHKDGLGVTIPYHKEDAPHFDEDCFDWADADLLTARYQLEQYTGLKDKNGKEIYEGDIVKQAIHKTHKDIEGYTIWQVMWCNEEARFELHYIGGVLLNNNSIMTDLARNYYEVIGNIHENPELLEEKK